MQALDPTQSDRIRLARRRSVETDIVLRDPEGYGEVKLRCRDVSVTGVFVRSLACVAPGVEFDCVIPLDDHGVVEARGRVTRVAMDTREAGMGIEFTTLCREARERLLAFMGADAALALA
ncbi:MAG: PilZ domain-containing protein [Myxococcales bacterium]|nr:PilZ domain-containing protein [Myxococcales bacterium]MCB9521066.1 PilZ domain-containing protein [Myxococcales bacterium]